MCDSEATDWYMAGRASLLAAAFIFAHTIPVMGVQNGADGQPLGADDLAENDHIIYLTDQWDYYPGNDTTLASPAIDSGSWEQVSTYLTEFDLAFAEWNGAGWFRLDISVDSTLANKPLALLIEKHLGASEVYLNGKKLFSLGSVGENGDPVKTYTDFKPRVIAFPEAGVHTLTVRFVNPDYEIFLEELGIAGFRFLLGDADYHLTQKVDHAMWQSGWQTFFMGALLVFAVIHLLLFSFYPKERRNLYFALFTLFLGFLEFSIFRSAFTNSPMETVMYAKSGQLIWIITILYALRFIYSLYQRKTPPQFWLFTLTGLALMTGIWFRMEQIRILQELFVLTAVLEMLRALSRVILQNRSGAWIIGFGIFCFLMSILYRVGINMSLITGETTTANILGSGVLILAMSVFLSRDFAMTQRRLEQKLKEVNELSEKTLEQEKRNKEIEIETRLLEAENERKSKELEEARSLQLSMLPGKIPEKDPYDISVYMQTATEVGGDYYDYSLHDDGTMTLALGDATGHGLKAGIMVAAAKSYFHMLAGEKDLVQVLHSISSGIKNMDLRMMYMGMILMRCNGYQFELTCAGMPPVLWYRCQQDSVDVVTLKGLPLGTRTRYPYSAVRMEAQPGDIILLMSDGLMELFNGDRELLGLKRIREQLCRFSHASSDEIIRHMRGLMADWSGDHKNEDDITLMAVKFRDDETSESKKT